MLITPLIQDHPFFESNALRSQGGGDQQASYNFLVDLITSTSSIQEVQSLHGFHEVVHRACSNYGKRTNTFSILRSLAGLSHALIMYLLFEVDNNKAQIRGTNLKELEVVGGSLESREKTQELLRRIKLIESIYDMGWKAIIPVAELLAIDFSQRLMPNNYFYNGWDIQLWYQVMSEGNGIDYKLDQLNQSIQGYPKEFGGYYIKYGSFGAAMEKALRAYDSVKEKELLYLILELAFHILYLGPKQGQIIVNDPIEMIIMASELAANKEKDKVIWQMAVNRVHYSYGGKALVEKLTEEVLHDIPSNIAQQKYYPTVISNIMATQKEKNNEWVSTLRNSFMRIELGQMDKQIINMNTKLIQYAALDNGLILPCNDKTEQNNIHDDDNSDWWWRLALLEAIRYSIKSGKPVICPFKGWIFAPLEKEPSGNYNYSWKCNEKCIIRLWLLKLENNSDLVRSELCII